MQRTDAVTTRQGGSRIWIVNHYADAPDRPTGGRHFDLARQLTAQGNEVTIFAAGFSHVTGRDERLGRWRLFRTGRFDGVRFVWVRTFPYRGNTWRRQVNMLSFLVAFLVVQTRFANPDAIVGSTVHPFAALAAWLVAGRRRARFVYEIRDLWPQTLVDLGAIREGSPGERLLRAIEAFLVRRASYVVALLPGIRDYLRERGLPADHVVYIPNGVDIASFDALACGGDAAPDALRHALDVVRRLRADGRFVVGYVGSFGRVNELDIVIRAAVMAEARDPGRIGLVLVGDGPQRPNLERLADRGAPVVVCPPVPRHCVPVVLRSLDAAVIHLTKTPVFRYGISPNKLFEYMAAARPVVFACHSAYDPVAAAGAGVSIPPDDPARMADAFLDLAHAGCEACAGMGVAGRAYVAREHDIERLAERLAAVVAGRVSPRDATQSQPGPGQAPWSPGRDRAAVTGPVEAAPR